ncbi:MAG TPA: DUF302 domain-containing protein [Myxococcaceae bacterium]|nr:DUF302 domain-containing protein [Myxococcaceae bacterium]
MTFGIRTTLEGPFDEVLARVPEALTEEGFGVLTEIDVRDTLQKKLGVETRRYRILGACNPPFAKRALEIEIAAGLVMPCNVVVYENDDGAVTVMAVDPSRTAEATGNAQLVELSSDIRDRLERALKRLGGKTSKGTADEVEQTSP